MVLHLLNLLFIPLQCFPLAIAIEIAINFLRSQWYQLLVRTQVPNQSLGNVIPRTQCWERPSDLDRAVRNWLMTLGKQLLEVDFSLFILSLKDKAFLFF